MMIPAMVWILFTFQATSIQSQNVNCASGPCQNEAICEDTDAGFQCFCVDGFAGELCETDFDDCSSSPCRNNATCTDHVAGYTCVCSTGFTGQNCQINIDECLSSPCLRNGTCIDFVNGFVCECFPPFRGDDCSLLPCDTLPCENEAVCRNDLNFNESLSGFVCDCITGFSGPRCEINLEDCDLENFTSCSGNGLCVDGINDYSCLCEPGWVGDYCGSPVDDCIGNSCKNNATCFDLHLGYQCTCKAGLEGGLCERERDECSEWQPCENEAICVDLFNDYRCDCTEGWFGVNCSEEVNECENNACQNGAQCIDVIGGFQCRCPPFYTGLLCETLYNPCAPEYNPCQNNANCIVPPDGQYRCFCKRGFTGVHCEVNVNECFAMPCENNSTCEDITAGYICHCTPGWQGQNCQDNIDDCASEPCLNGADCMDLHNGFECNCTQEYQGPICDEIVNFCLRDPCFHDSICLSYTGGYTCQCSSPYTGEQCLDLIDACQSAPCVNDGTCMNTVTGFLCNCPLPYTGQRCNARVDFCDSEPCLLGTCVSLKNDFVCLCPEYLTGKQCENVVDYCKDSPCENNGNCINAEFDFRCICAYGFTGRTCTEMVDFCSEEPCQNNANCSNIPGGFQCACPPKFTGDFCQNELPQVISSSVSLKTSSFNSITSLPHSALSTTSSLFYSTLLQLSSISTDVSTALLPIESVISSLTVRFSSVIQYTSEETSTLQSNGTSIRSFHPSFKLSDMSASSTKSTIYSSSSQITMSFLYMSSSPLYTSSTRSFRMTSNPLAISSETVESVYSISYLSSDNIAVSRSGMISTAMMSDQSSVISGVTSTGAVLSSSDITLQDSLSGFISQTEDSKYSLIFSSTSSEEITPTTTYNSSPDFYSTTLDESLLDTSSRFSILPSSKVPLSDILTTESSSKKSSSNMQTYQTSSKFYSPISTGVTSSLLDISTKSHLISSFTVYASNISPTRSSSYMTNIFISDSTTTFSPTLTPSTHSERSISASSVLNSFDSTKLSQDSSIYSKDSIPSPSISIKISVSVFTLETSFTEPSSFLSSSQIHSFSTGSHGDSLSSSVKPTFFSENMSFSNDSLTVATSSDDSASVSFHHTLTTTLTVESSKTLSVKSVSANKTLTSALESTRPMLSSSEDLHSSSTKQSSSDTRGTTSILLVSTKPLLSSSSFTKQSSSSISATTARFSSQATNIETQIPSVDIKDISSTESVFRMSFATSTSSSLSFAFQSVLVTSTAELHSPSVQKITPLTTAYPSPTSSTITTSPTELVSSSTNTMRPMSLSSSTSFSFYSTVDSSFESSRSSKVLSISSIVSEGPTLTRQLNNSNKYTSITFSSGTLNANSLTTTLSLITAFTQISTGSFVKTASASTGITSLIPGTTFISFQSFTSDSYLQSPFPSPSVYITTPLKSSLISELHSAAGFSSYFSYISSPPLSSSEISSTEIRSADSRSISSSTTLSSLPVSLYSSNLVQTSDTPEITATSTTRSYIADTFSVEIVQSSFSATISEASTSAIYNISPTRTMQYSSAYFMPSSSSVFLSTSVSSSEGSYFISTIKQSSSIITTKTVVPTGTIRPSQTTPSVSSTTQAPPTSCENFVCRNGGTCREDVSGTYCDCGENYLGKQCETETSACEGYVCENGGTCAVTLTIYKVQVPKCNCLLPFFGLRCENEKLIYYPTFIGSSYLKFLPPDILPGQSNEIYVSVKTTQKDATILYSANQEIDNKHVAFISLSMAKGKLRYTFSCDGVMTSIVETDMTVNTGDIYEVIVRQVWSAGPGEWCTAAVIVNSNVFVSSPVLTLTLSQNLGELYLGGVPRYTYKDDKISDTHIMDGFIGCIHNFQVNKKEIDMVTMATRGVNIDNCNVPVCQHNPCKNGATCHSSGEEWFCSCLPGYGGALCERKLCGVNPCQHGGTCIILEEYQDQLCLCAYGRGGALCEEAFSVTIPHFIGNQYDHSSYIAYTHPHYLEDDFEMEFSFILDNGSFDSSLILFLGNTGSYDGRRDFMAVGIEIGFIVYRFDLGSGYGQIYSAEQLDETLHQHSVRLGRDGHEGWLQVDNQRNVTGRSPGVLTALNTNSKLYVGYIELSEIGILPDGANFDDGFRGCIFNMKIKSHITKFIAPGSPPGHIVNGRNIGQCSSMSCDQNPCRNGAECRDLGASVYCICVEGWKGMFCRDVITVCDLAHACADGSTCTPDVSEGYNCLCPLGRKGIYCQEEMNISDPLFLGEGSYMAFEPVYVKREIDIRMQIKPNSTEGLLFYVAQRLHSHAGDFLSLTLNNGHFEFRVDVGSGLNAIQSEAEIQLDTDGWYTIEAGRNVTHFYISIDGETTFSQLRGIMTFLDVTTDFYIGGLPTLEDAAPNAFENEPVNFQGCIREFLVNEKHFELHEQGAKDGRSIEDCDGTNCGYSVCKNKGSCTRQDNDTFSCSCAETFIGRTCDVPIQCFNHSCINGNCSANGEGNYVCECFIGWKGIFCDEVVVLGTSAEFKTGSFIYFVDETFQRRNKSNTDISFSFKTTKIMCLIFWNGQTYTDDEDYLGVGIQDGRLRLVWNLGWYSRGEIITSIKFNDGNWHTVIIEREKQILALDVDGVKYESRVSGDFYTLDTFGEFFWGSFKEGRVREKTLGYFGDQFSGCLKDLQINSNSLVNFSAGSDGRNILPCDRE